MSPKAAMAIVALLSATAHTDALSQDIGDMIDLSAPVGFADLRNISVFRSVDRTRSIYYLIPNSLSLALDSNNKPHVGLLYSSNSKNFVKGTITITLRPSATQKQVEEVKEEIRDRDAVAKFAFVNPTSTSVVFDTSAADAVVLAAGPANPLEDVSAFSAQVDDLTLRAFLFARSHDLALAAISYTVRFQGASRTPEGALRIGDQEIRVSMALSGFCAPHPEKVVDAATGTRGCRLFPPYARREVRRVQRLLAAKGYDPGAADGVLGPRTDWAIRRFQADAGIVPDGLPSRELLERLEQRAAATAAPVRPIAVGARAEGAGSPSLSDGS